MVANIRAAGYDPADVDDVLLTHMHPDHACGVTSAEGVAVFPNATVWADKDDAAFWLDPNSEALLPDGQQAFVEMARKAIEPYAARGRFKTFDDGHEVIPGFRAIATAGHTPGHTSYLMGEGEDAVLSGFCPPQDAPAGKSHLPAVNGSPVHYARRAGVRDLGRGGDPPPSAESVSTREIVKCRMVALS